MTVVLKPLGRSKSDTEEVCSKGEVLQTIFCVPQLYPQPAWQLVWRINSLSVLKFPFLPQKSQCFHKAPASLPPWLTPALVGKTRKERTAVAGSLHRGDRGFPHQRLFEQFSPSYAKWSWYQAQFCCLVVLFYGRGYFLVLFLISVLFFNSWKQSKVQQQQQQKATQYFTFT